MLISRVSEGVDGGAERGDAEYRTADELFELMARDHGYQVTDNQSLSTGDLVLLYKNLDVGTKLMSDATVQQRQTPNQRVETIVYKDDKESDDSDVSEIYSSEDLRDVFAVNQERIDLINHLSYDHHPLCHKFGDFDIQTSDITSQYDSNFLFKDPYIKQQLQNLTTLPDSMGFDRILPTSLLDYICCKRLEDNYNFYMDNIIIYVQHTIEQLKRISNGDYLNDRAREKWKELEKDLVIPNTETTKVLATSVSIPIHVMGKVDGHRSTWDDLVHSEVDVRSLSKILEKKIIIEVPKLICGSYKLFSERSADNLIISCKKDMLPAVDKSDEGESRVDVVFQLKPSGSGHVISNINSIMILQKIPSIVTPDVNRELPQEITFGNYIESIDNHARIVEIDEEDNKEVPKNVVNTSDLDCSTVEIANKKSISDTSDSSLSNILYISSSQTSTVDDSLLKRKVSMKALKSETNVTLMSPDELRCTIRRLNIQTPVLEETEESSFSKKKSQTRVRIKSPYENQSYFMEEKKRKKLLEIREKREKKKMALSENCKITKHKYGKGVVMAQPSSSVTKLSITNKSFYNSIYGENVNHECGFTKKSHKSQKKEMSEKTLGKGELENGFLNFSFAALDRGLLDDGNTETIVQMHNCEDLNTDTCPTPISPLSNYNTDILSHLVTSSGTYCNSEDESNLDQKTKRDEDNTQEAIEDNCDIKILIPYQSKCDIVPTNTPKETGSPGKMQDGNKKTMTTVECRKSIDKIYDLLKSIDKRGDNTNVNTTTQYASSNTGNLNIGTRPSSSIQDSDSGTSVKHHIVSSNPSTFSFVKNKNLGTHAHKEKKRKEGPSALLPKVMISTKLQTSKVDSECHKTDRKRVVISPKLKVSDNPLKTISQLLHEFNNVHKTRHKTHKKTDHEFADGKTGLQQGLSKKPKPEFCTKEPGLAPLKCLAHKERRSRVLSAQEVTQASHQVTNNYNDDKYVSKHTKKNISDIIDEAKESRGEAVRGPSKQYSRIDTLAQPKKCYVLAHKDEYQNRYGRNIMVNKLHRATTSAPLVEKHNINTNYLRNKRKVTETASIPSAKPGNSTVPPLERVTRPRRSASTSPARKCTMQLVTEPSPRQITPTKSPDLKNKMVAVESYVNSHYGLVPIVTNEVKGHEVQKSRVPLIPNDIELESLTSTPTAEESTALGKKLHYMVDTMINTNAPALSILTECKESTSKLNEGFINKFSADSLLKIKDLKSESDYPVDVFEDKSILTAVSCVPKDTIHEDKVVDETIDGGESYEMQSLNSVTELQKLENALYQRMSVGAFPKRLRIKNLTLTPKQSLQQVIVVQSGDEGSLLVKSSLSQCLRKSGSTTNSLTTIKSLAAISNTNVNWGFTNIPLQVATIGYAFPKIQPNQCSTLPPCIEMLLQKPSREREDVVVTCKRHKTSQCFKGVHEESCLEQATQANIVVSMASSSNSITDAPIGKTRIRKESNIVEACELNEANIKKTERVQTKIIEKFGKVEPQTEKCDTVKQITGNYDTVQLLTKKCKNIKQMTENFDNEDNTIPSKVSIGEEVGKSKISVDNEEEISTGEALTPEAVDHSTSLDILMGLLNEIRKITGESFNKNVENKHDQNSKELEILLDNAATHESSIDNYCRDVVSVSSLPKLNPFNSEHSIGLLDISNNVDTRVKDKENQGQIGTMACIESEKVDKEVSVEIEKQYVNQLTDAPSRFFPIAINHSTNFTDSVIEILRVPSNQSVYSFAKYETLYRNLALDETLEQPLVDSTKILSKITCAPDNFNIFNDNEDEKIRGRTPFVEPVNLKIETMTVVSNNLRCASRLLASPCVSVGADCDPLLDLKRDVLVTVYSILVFTVFAALSFPQLFFQVQM